MAVTFRYAVRTHLGTVRANNEDSALGSPHVLLLADGMGGHAAGEVASAVAMRVFAELAAEVPADARAAGEQITRAGRSTRHALQLMSDADPVLESMGTTFLAVVARGDDVTVGHIGDSRVYALRGESLYQVTTDHTHVQRLVDTGQLTPDKARTHPYRAMLLRSLDDQPGGPDLDLIDVELAVGDRLLLCSDGLSDYLSPEHIGELLAVADRDEAAEALVDAALRVGTRDNVTVVVADVEAETQGNGVLPTYAGAVVDQLDLSPDAAAALVAALPDVDAFVPPPAVPVDDDAIVAEVDPATGPVDGLVASGGADGTDVVVADPDGDAADGTDEDAIGPSSEHVDGRTADENVTAEHVADEHREPALPGLLGAALMLALALALVLLL